MAVKFQGKPLVYLAMRLSDESPAKYLSNVGRMVREAVRLWKAGYPTYVPALDYLILITAAVMDKELPQDQIYRNSLAIQERCDVLYIPIGYEISPGVQAEIEQAERDRQPIVRRLEHLSKVKRVDGIWILEN